MGQICVDSYNLFNKEIVFESTYIIQSRLEFTHLIMGELSFGGRWTPKLTKGPYNSSNWVEGYEIVTDKYTL